ncbi:MAG TPA: DUF5666 domain-containing protein [Terriglobia bacterium]|nr:DUF5666 domain-containing protein [Terriglobia bacterium]
MSLGHDLIRATGIGVVGVCCCLLPVLAAAAYLPQESNFDLEGPISKQAPGKLTIDQGQGIFFRVAYDDKTAIVKDDGSSGSEKDLKVGLRVHVVGDLQASGEIKAARIEIEPKEGSPAKEDLRPPNGLFLP